MQAAAVGEDRILTIPNVISVVRLLCVPIFLWLLFDQDDRLAAAWLLAVLGATDWVDGWIARRYGQVSKLGKILDPVADRVLLIVGVTAILIDGSAPLGVGVLSLVREGLVAVSVLALAALGARRIDVTWYGKAGTLLVMIAFPLFLLGNADQGAWSTFGTWMGWACVVPGLVLGYLALAQYVPLGLEALREGRAARAAAHDVPEVRLSDTSRRRYAAGGRMKAVIMAGGEGTRLRPLTSNLPKPMMPLANKPMMEHVIDLLRRHGFDDIVVTLAFMPDAIRNHFGDGSEYGVHLEYATEETPLGTAGSVRNAAAALDERFLVISGDVLTDIDLEKVVAFHEEKGALATIGLVPVENPLEFGIVITKEDGAIERFLEKPSWGQVFSDTINTGIFVLEPEIFDHIAPDQPGRLLLRGLPGAAGRRAPALRRGGRRLLGGRGHPRGLRQRPQGHPRPEGDGGRPRLRGRRRRLGGGGGRGPSGRRDRGARGHRRQRPGRSRGLSGRVRRASGRTSRSGPAPRSERSIVQDNAYLGEGVRLAGAVVGRACDVRRGARCEDGSVLGDECFIGEDAVVGPGVKVYPFKTVEAAAVVNTSIVWESRGARSLFAERGVVGLANVDITPEFAARLAMAFGTTLKKDSTVVTSRDSSRAARMLKRAMMAGLNAAGVNVSDLEVASVPVTRFQARATRQRRRPDRAPPGPTTLNRSRCASSATTAPISTTTAGARSSATSPARTSGGCCRARSATSTSRPARSSTTPSPSRPASTCGRSGPPGSRSVIDYGYGSTAFVMPNLLSKLGTEVLAVNPYVSTAGILAFDRAEHAQQVAGLVRTSGAALGAVLDPDGEQLTLIDDSGRILDDTSALLVILELLGDDLADREVALPVAITRHAAAVVTAHGGRVRPTKLAPAAVMEAAGDRDVVFAAGLDGGFVLPEFVTAFDGSAMLVKTLELLARRDVRLSSLVADLPDRHVVRESVVTPWEQKGTVMRTLMERTGDREVILVDGVKVHHDEGWVLALARSRRTGDERLGGGRHRSRRPSAGRGVRPAHRPDDQVIATG